MEQNNENNENKHQRGDLIVTGIIHKQLLNATNTNQRWLAHKQDRPGPARLAMIVDTD